MGPLSWPRHRSKPLILGHRGASAVLTENTLPAFQRAMDDGADGVELDTRLCASGEAVVFHDDTLDRLAGRPGAIAALPLSRLRDVELPGGTRIPTLEETLAEMASRGARVNVEIKPPRAPDLVRWTKRVAEVVLASGTADRILITSFHPGVVALLRARWPSLDVGQLFHSRQSRAMRAAWRAIPGLAAVHPEHVLIDPRRIARWHRRGLAVGAWTVDDPKRARQLASLGVTAIITNDPVAIIKALASLRR